MFASALPTLCVSLVLFGQMPADNAFPPHRIVGNVYYVGSTNLAAYLITTDQGHILINSGFEETVPLIRASIESLGFKMSDVKILLESHAHDDHVAGHAQAQELSGAKVYVMKGDEEVIASGGKGQYLYTSSRWKACPVDRVLKDGEKVELGGTTLVARRTPGHTRGCTTWTWRAADGDKSYNVVIIGSPNVNPGYELVGNKDYPEIADDFAKTFDILQKLPCDVFLGAHGNYYGMLEKYDRLKKNPEVNPWIDAEGYRTYVNEKKQAFLAKLAEQKKAAGNPKSRIASPAVPDDPKKPQPRERVDHSFRTLEGHAGSVMAVSFSPDGKQLASSSRDGSIRIWNPQAGTLLRTWNGHEADVYIVVYSPRGDMLASGSGDKTIKLWNATTGDVLRTMTGHEDIVRSVAFSPDQKSLASVSVDQTVRLWDVETGRLQQTLNGHTARVKSVVYSPDGTWIATAASDRTIRIWQTGSGKETGRLEGHTGDIETLALSPEGNLLASSSNDTTIRLWNLKTMQAVRILQGHTAEVDAVEFSPDGEILASGGKDTFIKIWDVESGNLLRTLTGHTGRVESLTFAPGGKIMATGGGGGDTTVKLWNLAQE